MIDLDEYCREENRAKIHKAEPTKNTGRVSKSKLRGLKCNQNFACPNICDYNQIISLTELRNKKISCWSLH